MLDGRIFIAGWNDNEKAYTHGGNIGSGMLGIGMGQGARTGGIRGTMGTLGNPLQRAGHCGCHNGVDFQIAGRQSAQGARLLGW